MRRSSFSARRRGVRSESWGGNRTSVGRQATDETFQGRIAFLYLTWVRKGTRAVGTTLSQTVTFSILLVTLLCLPFNGTACFASATPHFSFAYMQEACGPTDGIATEFYFTATQAAHGKYKEPFLRIAVDQTLPKTTPQDHPIRPATSDVIGWRCLRPGACAVATSGFLRLSKFTRGVGAHGDYELHFQDGTVEKGHFDAIWYRNYFLCG